MFTAPYCPSFAGICPVSYSRAVPRLACSLQLRVMAHTCCLSVPGLQFSGKQTPYAVHDLYSCQHQSMSSRTLRSASAAGRTIWFSHPEMGLLSQHVSAKRGESLYVAVVMTAR